MNKEFWRKNKILVTGGYGFLGSYLVPKLENLVREIYTPSHKEHDLTKENKVRDLFKKTKPDIVIHLASDFGGIGYIKQNPGNVFYNNVMINTLVLEYSKKHKVKKFVGIGTAFSYPKNLEVPFKEEDLWRGEVEKDTASYSLPKKMMLLQSQAYRKQFNLNAIHLLLTSIYGPGTESSFAIPSLIKRFDEAISSGKKEVVVWGTGDATRDLLYVEDATEAIIKATELYNKLEPINIGSGRETKIKTLVEKIAEIMNFNGKIIWDPTKPEGPKRIFLDTSKSEREFNFKAKTFLEEGLKKAIIYYKESTQVNSRR